MTQQLEFPTTTAVAGLMAGDPRHAEEFRVVFAAIQADYDAHGTVDVNRVRPAIPSWVYPRVIGAAYSVLRNKEFLMPTGDWVTNTDAKGRNQGKPQKVYVLTERIA